MKKLVVILCMLGVLFGGEKSLVERGEEAFDKKDYKTAIKFWEQACSKKIGAGCRNLANVYFSGIGAEQDWKKAGENLSKACDFGDGVGCEIFSNFIDDKKEIEQYIKKNNELFQKGL